MRKLPILLLALTVSPCLWADPLTASDRETLLGQLDKLQDAADARVAGRFAVAVAAFREAAASEEAAVSLYLKCIEKVQFDDQYRKSQDFREWRRNEAEKLKSMSFKRALRHQLRWLILTLKVASNESPDVSFEGEASQLVNEVFGDLKNLKDQQQTLKQSVMGTVFAQAYKLTNVSVKNWPMSPVDLKQVYDEVILPPYRKLERVDDLRAAWMKRIQQESDAQEIWTRQRRDREEDDKRVGTKEALRTPEMEKFIAEVYPDLLWQMEVDVFQAGDERAAALRMFQHIEKYMSHPKVEGWAEQLRSLLTVQKAEEIPADSMPAES
ncbi:hypothetical protein HNR46_002937 [Haloferula luteola]|uniref:Secreted protein n=1 Tax=Haloferula luteola TaxID=595692 RepID=A0A840VFU4_9BACT|nr:hypothetical protein [Haloferula luteola]MBB5352689.1 hypothetical protein [Haloferula luteola]